MELKFKGQFNRDIDINNRELLEAVKKSILNIKSAKSVSEIYGLKKLKKYQTHYRIKINENYRLGIIRSKIVWLVRFGHRSAFYKKFP